MAKFHKVYPSFFNGISQQIPELMIDSQCKDMVNCIPDLVLGASKRPPATYITHNTTLPLASKIVHTYDRGEDEEEYIFVATGNSSDPLKIYNKVGVLKNLAYASGDITTLKNYLTPTTIKNLKGLTVQDRTFMLNTEETVGIASIASTTTIPTAFYWLKRASADSLHPYRYAVYLDGTLFEYVHETSDEGAEGLALEINYLYSPYKATVIGSTLKIVRHDEADFTFSSWDSWGDQASFGWKEKVTKLSDLPSDLAWEDVVVEITGDDNNEFTNYFVKSTGYSWIETRDPADTRGSLTNMPIYIDRQSDGTFYCALLDWEETKVGDVATNPSPSFIGTQLSDLFFYKNRLGLASDSNIVLSETAGYYNFYIKSVLTILDTDPIDIAIASTKASKIQYTKPFQGSLYIFTKDGQYEMTSAGITSPTTVSIEVVSNFPMNTDVAPVVNGTSLFFISATHNQQQLREYRKNEDTLTVSGIDLNITTPTLIDDPIQKILVNGVLGYVFCTTLTNEVYLYSFKDNSAERLQSAWSRWCFYEGATDIVEGSFEYELLDNLLILVYKTDTKYVYNTVELAKDAILTAEGAPLYPSEDLYPSDTLYPSGDSFLDTTDLTSYTYKSEIKLPDWYPHVGSADIGSPKDKVLVKKVIIEGEGQFDASVYRHDYNVTYSKTHDFTTIQDLDLHVNSKVGNCDIYISNETSADFRIKSLIVEGLYSPTSKVLR